MNSTDASSWYMPVFTPAKGKHCVMLALMTVDCFDLNLWNPFLYQLKDVFAPPLIYKYVPLVVVTTLLQYSAVLLTNNTLKYRTVHCACIQYSEFQCTRQCFVHCSVLWAHCSTVNFSIQFIIDQCSGIHTVECSIVIRYLPSLEIQFICTVCTASCRM